METHEEDDFDAPMGQPRTVTTVDSIQTKRLYVGHLKYKTTWQQLKDHFKRFVIFTATSLRNFFSKFFLQRQDKLLMLILL